MSERRGVARRMQQIKLTLIRQMFEKAPPGAINLGLGEPAFDTAPEILATAREALAGGRLGYTFNGGMAPLREAVAARYPGAEGAASVCITVGANGGLLGSMMASVDPGDEVLVPDPGFPTYEAVATLAGATPVRYPLPPDGSFAFSAEALRPRLTPATRAVVINSPSNPTGHVIPRAELEALAALADEADLTVIADEVYEQFWYGERSPSYAEVTNRGLVVNSLSKTEAMTGWRVGWVVGPPEFIKAVTAINQHSVTCAPALAQRAAITALQQGFAERAERTRADFGRRRELMLEMIERDLGLPYVEPGGAFFALLEAAPAGNSLEVALDILEKTGVITVPGVGFGDQATRFLRLSFAASEADIREGLGRMAEYFSSARKRRS
jgi:aspartate/methionine/tyrosine aminotransferase